jgi:hypothetical protein
MRPLRAMAVLVVALAPVLSSCGGGDDDESIVIAQLDADELPRTILGLDVEQEDVAERLKATDRPYVEATGLYSLRDGDRLEGTIQLSRFKDDVDPDDEQFQLSIVNQIGSTQPRAFRMADEIVYLTASKRQSVAVFFEDRSFVVLSTLETFEHSRELLRSVLELDL